MMRDSDLGKVLPWPYKLSLSTVVCRDNAWTVHSAGFYDFRIQFLVKDNFWLVGISSMTLQTRNNSTTSTYVKGGLISEGFSHGLKSNQKMFQTTTTLKSWACSLLIDSVQESFGAHFCVTWAKVKKQLSND